MNFFVRCFHQLLTTPNTKSINIPQMGSKLDSTIVDILAYQNSSNSIVCFCMRRKEPKILRINTCSCAVCSETCYICYHCFSFANVKSHKKFSYRYFYSLLCGCVMLQKKTFKILCFNVLSFMKMFPYFQSEYYPILF